MNGIDEWLETPDAPFWNDSAGLSEPSYCWAVWVDVVAGATDRVLWSKTPNILAATWTDWVVYVFNTELFIAAVFDLSADASIASVSGGLADGWHHLAATKHDDSALSSSVITYVDGEADRADTPTGTYVQQEDNTTVVRIGADASGGNLNTDPIAGGPLGPVFRQVGTGAVWTPDAIRRDYQLGRAVLGI